MDVNEFKCESYDSVEAQTKHNSFNKTNSHPLSLKLKKKDPDNICTLSDIGGVKERKKLVSMKCLLV